MTIAAAPGFALGAEPVDAGPIRPRASRWVGRAGSVAFCAWGVVAVVVVATLMAGHWYTLPRPQRADPELAQGLNTLRAPGEEQRWMAVHVLYSECRCSQRILEHLFSSARPAGVVEKVVLVGDREEYATRARAAGYAVEVVSKRELEARYHLVSAPLLAVVAPDGSVRHVGGYTDRKQGPDIVDVAVIEEVRRGVAARERPLFGCAVSAELQRFLDPIGIKYSRGE